MNVEVKSAEKQGHLIICQYVFMYNPANLDTDIYYFCVNLSNSLLSEESCNSWYLNLVSCNMHRYNEDPLTPLFHIGKLEVNRGVAA